mmetsp:Transcript_19200/g.31886  ORF Transcript_19200/g.31886 Transcript_19200/m.31886 type:complete len:224 (+) Transcript_19200:91-762(+)|eukprot:CAMPEP_0119005780 /NCGR_PEP_ID=MMETSP1176-20130426/1925_1 /TAXON_ID=265551 /ORGANISM="Synedropsis recta cf, Strain CCMP1620" /LENGTH=223 /DNA_ID=CAMNT_0006957625 /DNA_START=33 /DNA_END=704 /DNA_ORIENTATION=+
MGRYSSVQAYADNNANMRSIPYEQASGAAEAKTGAVKAEKVHNPYGSTAGAGSGEFHVYRHARAREALRWKEMNDAERERALDEEYQLKLEANQTEEERKTAQRRKKRQRQKEAKMKKKNLALGEVNLGGDEKAEVRNDEFTYVPLLQQQIDDQKEEEKKKAPVETPNDNSGSAVKVPFANDGSFLEMMKKKIEQEKTVAEAEETEKQNEGPPTKKRAIDGKS